MHGQFVLLAWPLAPVLLANYPNTRSLTRAGFGGLLGDNIFETLHTLEAGLEGLAGCEDMEEVGIVLGLVLDDIVVGGWVKEWRCSEVVQHCVCVQWPELHNEGWVPPLDLVHGGLLRGGAHLDGLDLDIAGHDDWLLLRGWQGSFQ